MDSTKEQVFQNDIIQQLLAQGGLLGQPEAYDRVRALYPEDLLGFIKETQPQQWPSIAKSIPRTPTGTC